MCPKKGLTQFGHIDWRYNFIKKQTLQHYLLTIWNGYVMLIYIQQIIYDKQILFYKSEDFFYNDEGISYLYFKISLYWNVENAKLLFPGMMHWFWICRNQDACHLTEAYLQYIIKKLVYQLCVCTISSDFYNSSYEILRLIVRKIHSTA